MGRYRGPLNNKTLPIFLLNVEQGGWRVVDLSGFDFVDLYAMLVLTLSHLFTTGRK